MKVDKDLPPGDRQGDVCETKVSERSTFRNGWWIQLFCPEKSANERHGGYGEVQVGLLWSVWTTYSLHPHCLAIYQKDPKSTANSATSTYP